ncbi:MAG: T9SS type A sorting domain-containing protein [Bacteroidia bacterium]|nr:T9SS type A sorting domain-containing protein [Bacteroidia bacterium]
MKVYFYLIAFFLFFGQFTKAQCPTSPLTFANQAQIDAFPSTYPSCTVIPDGIDVDIMGSNITDLGPLSQLTSVLGVLEIRNCPLLTNLNGLHNLKSIGNDTLDGFILRQLPLLNSLSALNNLDSIHGEFTIRTCNALTSLNGLNKLKKAYGSVIVRDNSALQNLNGLDSLFYIGETLEIVENPQLSSIAALSHVNTIVGGVEGGIFIENNAILSNLTGLGNSLTNVGSNLDITLNGNLNLCNVPSICKYIANPPVGATITISANKVDCNSQSEVLAKCALGVNENNTFKSSMRISPNPVSDHFKIISNDKEVNVEIFDIYGKKISNVILDENSKYSIANLPTGIYLLKTTNTKEQQTFTRIVKL